MAQRCSDNRGPTVYTSFQLAVDIIEVAKTCIVYNTQESLHHNNYYVVGIE